MSLQLTSGSTDNIAHGTGVTGDPTVFTAMFWVFIPTADSFNNFFVHGDGPTIGFNMRANGLNPAIIILYSGTNGQADSSNNSMNAGVWSFVCGTFDGVNAPNIYVGELYTPPTEVSYSGSRKAPTGSRTTNTTDDWVTGNNIASSSNALGADFAMVHFINGTALTLPEIQWQWYRSMLHANTQLYCEYGFNGTGTQPDWSGLGNDGTQTGAVIAPHMPRSLLSPFPFYSFQEALVAGLPWPSPTKQMAHLLLR